MTQESTLRSHVVKILKKAKLDPHPVENPIMIGFPDVEFIGGTMELKQADHWPARSTTPLRLDHYSKEQRVWHTRRWTKGGNITVLVQVGSEYLLFTGIVAASILGHVPESELKREALALFPSLGALKSGLAKAVLEAR